MAEKGRRYKPEPFVGTAPITVSRMGTLSISLTIHLVNHHGVLGKEYYGPEERAHRHLMAHLHGEFAPGQAHYHARPEFVLSARGCVHIPNVGLRTRPV